jgi:hypothetical protein
MFFTQEILIFKLFPKKQVLMGFVLKLKATFVTYNKKVMISIIF